MGSFKQNPLFLVILIIPKGILKLNVRNFFMKMLKSISRIIFFSLLVTVCVPVLAVNNVKQTRFQRYKKRTITLLKKYGWAIPLVILGFVWRNDIAKLLGKRQELPRWEELQPDQRKPGQNAQEQLNNRNNRLRDRLQRERNRNNNAVPLPPVATYVQEQLAHCLYPQNQLLHLPQLTGARDFNLPGVYHIRSQSRVARNNGWSCGPRALDNARILENRILGRNITDNQFENAWRGVDAHGTTTNADTARAAQQMRLAHFQDLAFRHGQVLPLIEYEFPAGSSLAQRQQAWIEQSENFWGNIHNVFHQPGAKCMHFANNIMSGNEPHTFLITCVKDQNNQISMYVADNMNNHEPLQAQREMRTYVHEIYNRVIR